MSSPSTLHISTSGLSSYEEGLLVQQLKMLRGHTRMQWAFADNEQSAVLHIERPANAAPQGALAQLSSADGSPPLIKRIEMPLRVFGLIELLQECEGRLPDPVAAPSAPSLPLSRRLAALPATGVGYLVQAQTLVAAENDQVLTQAASFDDLLRQLQALSADSEIRVLLNTPVINPLPFSYSYKRLLWALALAERGSTEHARFSGTHEFKLGAWPLFNEWQSSPVLLRLAALFSRQFSTLEQASVFAQTDAASVQAFLSACELCGLGVSSRPAMATPTRQEPAPGARGLLHRLRDRLGLGYRT